MKRKKCGSTSAARPKRSRRLRESARPLRGEEEIKTKIDLSHISRPGDVLKAITQKKEAAAPPAAAGSASCDRGAGLWLRLQRQDRRRLRSAPAIPAATVAPAAGCETEVVAPVAEKPSAPVTPAATFGVGCNRASGCRAAASRDAAVRPQWLRRRASAPSVTASAAPQAPVRPAASAQPPVVAGPPQPPAPRMIVPQTGPRPVYKAPPPRPVAPVAQAGAPAGTMRPAPGRPVPGQPIFQRPRPHGSGRRSAASVASGRTPSHASHAHGAGRCASARCWSGASASGTGTSWCSSGCARAPARPALCSAWRKRRPDEGLHAAAAHGGVE